MEGLDEKMLSKRVDRLYRCRNLNDVIAIVEEVLQEYEHCIQEQEDGFRSEVTTVKGYIYLHFKEMDLGAETLRMNKAKELLETTNMKISQIAKEVGFSNNSYFCRSFREFFGDTPEACRKGIAADEKTNTEVDPSI